MLTIEGNGAGWEEIKVPKSLLKYIDARWISETGTSTTDDIASAAAEAGYDTVHFKNIYDGDSKPSDVYAAIGPGERIKSADLITVDNNNEIIPLSERFNSEKEDIRYSRVLNNSALDYADRLRQTSRQYWEMLDILEDMAGGSQYHNPLDDILDESHLTEEQRLSK